MTRELRATRSKTLPDGQITRPSGASVVESFFYLEAKYSCSYRRANQSYNFRRLIPHEGASAIVTNVGVGCGGRGSVGRASMIAGRFFRERSSRARRTMLMRTAKACGSGTRCWCQIGGGIASPTGSRNTVNPPVTVTRRIRRREERAISRKTIARGMSECFR